MAKNNSFAPLNYAGALAYTPPFRFSELLDFFKMRAILGVEFVDNASYSRCARITLPNNEEIFGYLRVEDDPENNVLKLYITDSLLPAKDVVANRVRAMFDLDCEPGAVYSALKPLSNAYPNVVKLGTRLPGAFDAFETCCRAVLGQQISVAAASKLAARVASNFGTPAETQTQGLEYVWPAPREVLNISDIETAFGELGVIKTRSRVIAEIARMFEAGELTPEAFTASGAGESSVAPEPNASPATYRSPAAARAPETPDASKTCDTTPDSLQQMQTLLNIKGVGPWTANYIMMRVYSYTDAFLESDVGVVHALPDMTPRERLKLVEPCRPYRSYAVVNLWNSLG